MEWPSLQARRLPPRLAHPGGRCLLGLLARLDAPFVLTVHGEDEAMASCDPAKAISQNTPPPTQPARNTTPTTASVWLVSALPAEKRERKPSNTRGAAAATPPPIRQSGRLFFFSSIAAIGTPSTKKKRIAKNEHDRKPRLAPGIEPVDSRQRKNWKCG